MRIVIVGPGALGSLLTARLFLYQQKANRADNDILSLWLLDYRSDRAACLQKNGLFFEQHNQIIHCTPHVTFEPEVCADADTLFFCVKSTGVTAALDRIRSYLSGNTLFIAMQNGIGHLEDIANINCLAGVGVTSEGSTLVKPGHVRHGGSGKTLLGLLDHSPQDKTVLSQVATLLDSAGISTDVTDSPLKHVWAKLFVNVGINALTALHGCFNGDLLQLPDAMKTMEKAIREAEQIARAKNIPVEFDPVQRAFSVCKTTAKNTSSMLQDVKQQRVTEIDAINGAIVEEGKKLGIPTPVNAELVRQIKELEASYIG